MVRTVYDSIRQQKLNKTWGDNLVLFARCETLEYYYQIYKAVIVEREKQKYGYIQRVCNSLKINKMGGGIWRLTNLWYWKRSRKWKRLCLILIFSVALMSCRPANGVAFVCGKLPALETTFPDGTVKRYYKGNYERNGIVTDTALTLIIETKNDTLCAVYTWKRR